MLVRRMQGKRKSRRYLSRLPKVIRKTRKRIMRGGVAGSDIPSEDAVVLVNPDPTNPGARVFMSYKQAKKEGLF